MKRSMFEEFFNYDHPPEDIAELRKAKIRLAACLIAGLIMLMLVCTFAHSQTNSCAPSSACLSWTPPTQNTDGSALTDLKGYRIYYGTNSSSLGQSIALNSPGISSYVVSNLATGTYYFAITSVNSIGVESDPSIAASKAIVGQSGAKSNPPTNVTVSTTLTAFRIVENIDNLVVKEVGTIASGTPCDTTQSIVVGSQIYYRVPRAAVTWSGNWKPAVVVAQCS